jgi:hypothetical protein
LVNTTVTLEKATVLRSGSGALITFTAAASYVGMGLLRGSARWLFYYFENSLMIMNKRLRTGSDKGNPTDKLK